MHGQSMSYSKQQNMEDPNNQRVEQIESKLDLEFPLLSEYQLHAINIAGLPNEIKTDKFKTMAHNLRFFKQYKVKDGEYQQMKKNLQNEMKSQFEKLQNIDQIKSKRNENESKKKMFGADTLEDIHERSKFTNSKSQTQLKKQKLSVQLFDSNYLPMQQSKNAILLKHNVTDSSRRSKIPHQDFNIEIPQIEMFQPLDDSLQSVFLPLDSSKLVKPKDSLNTLSLKDLGASPRLESVLHVQNNISKDIFKTQDETVQLQNSKPRFTLKDLQTKNVDIKEIFRQLSPRRFPSTSRRDSDSNKITHTTFNAPQTQRNNVESSMINKEVLEQSMESHRILNLQLPQLVSPRKVNQSLNSHSKSKQNKEINASKDKTMITESDQNLSPQQREKLIKQKQRSLSQADIMQNYLKVKAIERLCHMPHQDRMDGDKSVVDILNKFKSIYDYNTTVLKTQVQGLNSQRNKKNSLPDALYVNLFNQNKTMTQELEETKQQMLQSEHQESKVIHGLKKSQSQSIMSKIKSKILGSLQRIHNQGNEALQPYDLSTLYSTNLDSTKKILGRKLSSLPPSQNSPHHPPNNHRPSDTDTGKAILPKIMNMHFVCLGEYLPLHDIEKNIQTFDQYKSQSANLWNMLKEKQRADKRKFLDQEELKYREKIKGKNFEKEERQQALEREKELQNSKMFKKHLQTTVKSNPLTESQFRKQFNILDARFTKAFMKEEVIENKIFEQEKLKIKQDIYLSRQHDKEKRKEIMFKRHQT